MTSTSSVTAVSKAPAFLKKSSFYPKLRKKSSTEPLPKKSIEKEDAELESLAVAELVKAAKIASISASISGASAWERPRYKLNRRYVGNAVISAVQSNKRKDEIEKKKTSSRISKTK